ncbi:MAG: hypothetical protein DIZ78_11360 [endosymbiont of Escarpia spicata]|uniref:Transporter n=1 Tax=endosymbiont of Escarpia spicata TaxID=2200908 RepID=A0A370DKV4_9GAMM|nr:MAG: hypothetical protein DIZ78_11360 [endosymbiont of Escarpia spicata]
MITANNTMAGHATRQSTGIVNLLLGPVLVAGILSAGNANAGVGDGPRAYQLAPVGTEVVTVIGVRQNSNYNLDGSPTSPAARVEVTAMAFQYTRVIDVGGNAAGLFAVLPFAGADGTLLNGARQPSSEGLGDVIVGGVVGLIGSPALNPKEFGAYKPGFGFGIVGKLALPTGEYDSSKAINIGTNRWSLQLGTALSWQFGDSMRPGEVTSLELTPMVSIYGDNEDPNGGNVLEQDPLYGLEMHVTHDFNRMFWGAFDAVYSAGGATTLDGVAASDDVEVIGVGFTIGATLPRGTNLEFSYGETIKDDLDSYDDAIYRIKIKQVF